MTHLHSDRIREDIRARGGEIGEEELGNLDFKLFTAEDLDKVVREDVEKFKAEKLLKSVDVRGYVLSTETGQLREV